MPNSIQNCWNYNKGNTHEKQVSKQKWRAGHQIQIRSWMTSTTRWSTTLIPQHGFLPTFPWQGEISAMAHVVATITDTGIWAILAMEAENGPQIPKDSHHFHHKNSHFLASPILEPNPCPSHSWVCIIMSTPKSATQSPDNSFKLNQTRDEKSGDGWKCSDWWLNQPKNIGANLCFFPGMEGQHQQNKMIPARSSKALPVVHFFGKTSKFG